jgi:hypothetical protein
MSVMNQHSDSELDYRPLVRRTTAETRALKPRYWVGNDDSARNHHGAIPAKPETILVHLSWKQNARGTPSFVGCYELNLGSLLEHGFIRRDSQPGKVRLRFIHDHDDVICIQVLGSRQRLEIGRFIPTVS